MDTQYFIDEHTLGVKVEVLSLVPALYKMRRWIITPCKWGWKKNLFALFCLLIILQILSTTMQDKTTVESSLMTQHHGNKQLLSLRPINKGSQPIDQDVLDMVGGGDQQLDDHVNNTEEPQYPTDTYVQDLIRDHQEEGNVEQTKVSSNTQKKKVLLYTRWRSGSSFTGDLFYNHPDIFYLFEPLGWIENKSTSDQENGITMKSIGLHYLSDALDCRFKGLLDYSKNVLHHTNRWFGHHIPVTFCNGLPFENCDYQHAEKLCRSKKIIVIKIIKLLDIKLLLPFMQEGVKVIHLVRDPRSMFLSRMDVQRGYETDHMSNTCKHMLADTTIQTAINTKNSELFDSSSILVRFEDIANDPELYAALLYKFINVPIHDDVYIYIRKSTNAKPGVKRYKYSRKRNTDEVLMKWRVKLAWRFVRLLQMNCRLVMISLGYKPAMDQEHLHDVTKDLYGHCKQCLNP